MMTERVTDLELLARWRTGDNSAGSALAKRHFSSLHRFFANKASGHEDDLVQQTLMACVEAQERFRGEGQFRSYLFGLARFQLLDHYRRLYRGRTVDLGSESARDLGTSPSAVAARREEWGLLDMALRSISVDQQIALELSYWEDLSAPEIAHVLNIPENTVYSRLRRAKAHLREALERLSSVPQQRARALALLRVATSSPLSGLAGEARNPGRLSS